MITIHGLFETKLMKLTFSVLDLIFTTYNFVSILVLLIYVFRNQSSCSTNLTSVQPAPSTSLSVPCTAAVFPLFLWMMNELIHFVFMLFHRIVVLNNRQATYILYLYAYRYYSYFHYLCSFVSSASFVSLWAHSYDAKATYPATILLAQQILLTISFGFILLLIPHYWSKIYSRDTLIWDGRLLTSMLPLHILVWAITFCIRNIGWMIFVGTVGLPYWAAKTLFSFFADISQFEEVCEIRYALFPKYFKEGRYMPQLPYFVSGGPAYDGLLTVIAFLVVQSPISFAIACWALSESDPYSVQKISFIVGLPDGVIIMYIVSKTMESTIEVVIPILRLHFEQRFTQFKSTFVHLQGALILSISCNLLEKLVASLQVETQGDGSIRYVITKLGPPDSTAEPVPQQDLLKMHKEDLENKRTERDKVLGENASTMDAIGAILFDYDSNISDDVSNFGQRYA